MNFRRVLKATAVTTLLAGALGGIQTAPASAGSLGCGQGACISFEAFGDENYAEVLMTGAFTGAANAVLNELRLCDEKTEQAWKATATITRAYRFDGQVFYEVVPAREFQVGPQAACSSFALADWVETRGDAYALHVDYDYKLIDGSAPAAWPQRYETPWIYNYYAVGCPTCR
jgi:hypothetical protein